jgi:hypothetical protein
MLDEERQRKAQRHRFPVIARREESYMKRPHSNERSAQIVAGDEARAAGAAPEPHEAAWCQWSSQIQQVDGRDMAMLKAAFVAGWESGQISLKNSRP